MILRKTDFRKRTTAPVGYMPGYARGDIGFTTGIDIAPTDSLATSKLKSLVEHQRQTLADPNFKEKKIEFLVNDTDYDKWNGYRAKVFDGDEYREEDKEADKIYEMVEKRVAEKTKKRIKREKGVDEPEIINDLEDLKKTFAQEKDALKSVGLAEWMNIPEAVVHKANDRNKTKYTPISDSLLTMGLKDKFSNQIETGEQTMTQNQKEGYLTQLVEEKNMYEIQDVQKARLLFKSARESDPSNDKPWLSSARLEQINGKIQEARNLLEQGLSHNIYSEDLWFELLKLAPKSEKGHLFNKAIKHLKTSTRIWKEFVDFQVSKDSKVEAYKTALKFCPTEIQFWLGLLNLHTTEEPEYFSIIAQAVEHCKESADLWLKWAENSEITKARIILNKANKIFKNSNAKIWIAASVIEEKNGADEDKIHKIVGKGLAKVLELGVQSLKDDDFLEIIFDCGQKKNFLTAKSVINFLQSNKLKDMTSINEFCTWTNRIYTRLCEKECEKQIIFFWLLSIENLKLTSEMKSTDIDNILLLIKNEQSLLEKNDILILLPRILLNYNNHFSVFQSFLNLVKNQFLEDKLLENECCDLLKQICDEMQLVLTNNQQKSIYIESCLSFLINMNISLAAIEKFISKFIHFPTVQLIKIEIEYRLTKGSRFPADIDDLIKLSKDKNLDQCDSFKTHKLISDIYLKNNYFQQNELIWKNYLIRFPEDYDAICQFALSKLRSKNIYEARSVYAKIINSKKISIEHWLNILEIEKEFADVQKNLIQKALKHFDQVDAIVVKDLELNTDHQKMRIPQLVKQFPNSVDLSILVGKIFYRENKIEKCKVWMVRAITINSNCVDAIGYLSILEPENFLSWEKTFMALKSLEGSIYQQFYRQFYLDLPPINFRKGLFEQFVAYLRKEHPLLKSNN